MGAVDVDVEMEEVEAMAVVVATTRTITGTAAMATNIATRMDAVLITAQNVKLQAQTTTMKPTSTT